MYLAGCGTYRTGSGGYRGNGSYRGPGELSTPGPFKAPSDYSTGTDPSVPETEMRDAHAVHGSRQSFVPHGPFKLFWPVNAVHINRGFRPAEDRRHEGLDLGGKRGLPILAAHDGVVIFAGNGFKGYGNMILIEYSEEWATLYAHLDKIAVREGQIVPAGDVIGAMGATGHATGVHLHFELMHHRTPVDPIPLLTGGASVKR